MATIAQLIAQVQTDTNTLIADTNTLGADVLTYNQRLAALNAAVAGFDAVPPTQTAQQVGAAALAWSQALATVNADIAKIQTDKTTLATDAAAINTAIQSLIGNTAKPPGQSESQEIGEALAAMLAAAEVIKRVFKG